MTADGDHYHFTFIDKDYIMSYIENNLSENTEDYLKAAISDLNYLKVYRKNTLNNTLNLWVTEDVESNLIEEHSRNWASQYEKRVIDYDEAGNPVSVSLTLVQISGVCTGGPGSGSPQTTTLWNDNGGAGDSDTNESEDTDFSTLGPTVFTIPEDCKETFTNDAINTLNQLYNPCGEPSENQEALNNIINELCEGTEVEFSTESENNITLDELNEALEGAGFIDLGGTVEENQAAVDQAIEDCAWPLPISCESYNFEDCGPFHEASITGLEASMWDSVNETGVDCNLDMAIIIAPGYDIYGNEIFISTGDMANFTANAYNYAVGQTIENFTSDPNVVYDQEMCEEFQDEFAEIFNQNLSDQIINNSDIVDFDGSDPHVDFEQSDWSCTDPTEPVYDISAGFPYPFGIDNCSN